MCLYGFWLNQVQDHELITGDPSDPISVSGAVLTSFIHRILDRQRRSRARSQFHPVVCGRLWTHCVSCRLTLGYLAMTWVWRCFTVRITNATSDVCKVFTLSIKNKNAKMVGHKSKIPSKKKTPTVFHLRGQIKYVFLPQQHGAVAGATTYCCVVPFWQGADSNS